MDKLSIHNEMREFDRKNRQFYDGLNDEERKKFSLYLMIRWGSAVRGGRELQEFYVIATNERLNKHFFAVNRHPKLQWLMATSISPNLGPQDHVWISNAKKDKTKKSDTRKFLSRIFPHLKSSDIDVLEKTLTKDEIDALKQDYDTHD